VIPALLWMFATLLALLLTPAVGMADGTGLGAVPTREAVRTT
jgi:hypothetical protein